MGEDLEYWRKKGFDLVDGKLVKSSTPSTASKPKKSKYGNRKAVVDGFTFDSEKEARFYTTLKLRKKAGEIKDFKKQHKMSIEVNGIHIANYFLDFLVEHPDGTLEYIDIKAKKKDGKFLTTDTFQLKKKLVEAIYGIKIKLQ